MVINWICIIRFVGVCVGMNGILWFTSSFRVLSHVERVFQWSEGFLATKPIVITYDSSMTQLINAKFSRSPTFPIVLGQVFAMIVPPLYLIMLPVMGLEAAGSQILFISRATPQWLPGTFLIDHSVLGLELYVCLKPLEFVMNQTDFNSVFGYHGNGEHFPLSCWFSVVPGAAAYRSLKWDRPGAAVRTFDEPGAFSGVLYASSMQFWLSLCRVCSLFPTSNFLRIYWLFFFLHLEF